MDNQKFLILSCDGGGIRGVVTTMLLQELGQDFLNQVNFFAGTSTGGIIALGLAGGIQIDQLADLYRNQQKCNTIFPSSSTATLAQDKKDQLRAAFSKASLEAGAGSNNDIWRYLGLLEQIIAELIGPSYSNAGRKEVLKEYLSAGTLASLKSKALVTTFELNGTNSDGQAQWLATTLHNLPNLPNSDSNDTLTLDAAMCTSSAPLYFPPYQLPSGTLCIDGGVFANNPSTVALGAALASGIMGSTNLSNAYLLSVGTGANVSSFPYTGTNPTSEILAAIPYGILGWLWPESEDPVPPFPLLDVMFDGTSEINDSVTGMLLPSDNYRRANVSLRESHIALDDCSKIDALVSKTQHYIKHNEQWQGVVSWVKTNFGS